MNFKLIFNPSEALKKRKLERNQAIQKIIDTEVIRRMEPYTPKDKRYLIDSATMQTRIGEGKVKQKMPYARRLYYSKNYNFKGAPKRGARWFQRMKADQKRSILKDAKREARIK